jgi:hypothetical protein
MGNEKKVNENCRMEKPGALRFGLFFCSLRKVFSVLFSGGDWL